MCSAYWNLVSGDAPAFSMPCGGTSDELQTHFMGEAGSCGNYYRVGEPVDELEGISVAHLPNDENDQLIGSCREHNGKHFALFDAEIVEGRVVRVWPLQAPVPPSQAGHAPGGMQKLPPEIFPYCPNKSASFP